MRLPERLNVEQADLLSSFCTDAITDMLPTKHLTKAQAFSLLVGMAGLDGSKTNSTYTLVYTDHETGRSNYQTACMPTYSDQSPFRFEQGDNGSTATVSHKAYAFPTQSVRVHSTIDAASNHYYSRVDEDFNELPTALIASPRSACSAGCDGCARGTIASFSRPSSDYIKQHTDELQHDYEERGWDPKDLRSVNITTGSQPSEDKEADMMVAIMGAYKEAGFTEAGFMLYNYALQSEEAMRAVRSAGAIGYIGTIETMDDELRRKHWGKVKGGQTFEDHLRRYERAKDIGFPIIETNYVVGIDPYDAMMDGIRRLDEAGVVVVPNVKRSYNPKQLGDTHPDVWERGFGNYVLGAFDNSLDTCEDRLTIKQFAGTASVDWLNQHRTDGPTLTHFMQLPVRHT